MYIHPWMLAITSPIFACIARSQKRNELQISRKRSRSVALHQKARLCFSCIVRLLDNLSLQSKSLKRSRRSSSGFVPDRNLRVTTWYPYLCRIYIPPPQLPSSRHGALITPFIPSFFDYIPPWIHTVDLLFEHLFSHVIARLNIAQFLLISSSYFTSYRLCKGCVDLHLWLDGTDMAVGYPITIVHYRLLCEIVQINLVHLTVC